MNQLLVALLKKEIWHNYGGLTLKILKNDELRDIFRAMEVLHETTESDLTIDGLALGLSQCFPEKKAEGLRALVNAWSPAYDPALVQAYFEDAERKARAFDIATTAAAVFEGQKTWDELSTVMARTVEEQPNPEFEFVAHNLESLRAHQEAKGGFKWRLNKLNELLGHLPRKTFGFVFARPDSGKTTLLCSEITNFALQTDQPILWVANEEDAAVVKMRAFQSVFAVTEAKLFSDAKRYDEAYKKRVGERLMISGDSQLNHRTAIERALKRYKPAILVIDQLDKVGGFKADREDTRLGGIYQWARRMSNEYNLVAIGVTQANSAAEGTKWLKMNHIADSHTSKAAEADWILGIGKLQGNEDSRFLHTPKDKLPMSPGKVADSRHGFREVQFKPDIARFED